MDRRIRYAAIATLAACMACAYEATGPREKLTLTASQASVLLSRAELIADADSGLAWLADSMDCVLKAGAEAQRIIVTVDGLDRIYYAVGLTRQFAGPSAFSTFHLIAFDFADNPKSFLLANGYAPGVGGSPPASVSGSFGGGTVFAHFVQLSDPDVTTWVAMQGEAAFVLGDLGAGCAGSMSVTCHSAPLIADFRIDEARPEGNPGATHAASQTHVVVPGIVLLSD